MQERYNIDMNAKRPSSSDEVDAAQITVSSSKDRTV